LGLKAGVAVVVSLIFFPPENLRVATGGGRCKGCESRCGHD
jgi:hypothetical protein